MFESTLASGVLIRARFAGGSLVGSSSLVAIYLRRVDVYLVSNTYLIEA